MKLSDQILRKPLYVAFGQAMAGGGITSVDLVAVRDSSSVTMTASDGSAAVTLRSVMRHGGRMLVHCHNVVHADMVRESFHLSFPSLSFPLSFPHSRTGHGRPCKR